ncbi:MAG: type I glyceraldehyde-3-phosphate dehydrogenase [Gammaproteobacteria bacterium]|nr:type I glyceraldehyde-3-phosphate dehydrogenase [Gammaproteobacteria bacterium]
MKIAINGFGRIGRNILRAIYEGGYSDRVQVVAINDLAPTENNAHLLAFDTTHGRFTEQLEYDDDTITINGDTIPVFSQRNPEELPWRSLNVDVVFECTGFFRTRDGAGLHIKAGAKKVLVSAPGKKLDKTIVYGVNHGEIDANDTLVSNASCTTNCLAHIVKALHDAVGIESGLVTTVHAYTNTQNLLDSFHKDKRRGRAAAYSLIPTSTGSAKAISSVIPAVKGRLDAVAVRVPTLNVSLLDFTFLPETQSSIDEIHGLFKQYAQGRKKVFELSSQPLVSIDYNHNPASCIVDLEQTRQVGSLYKVQAWYDNEWGFSNRMLDTALIMYKS